MLDDLNSHFAANEVVPSIAKPCREASTTFVICYLYNMLKVTLHAVDISANYSGAAKRGI